jgi:hypothetical protein
MPEKGRDIGRSWLDEEHELAVSDPLTRVAPAITTRTIPSHYLTAASAEPVQPAGQGDNEPEAPLWPARERSGSVWSAVVSPDPGTLGMGGVQSPM